MTALEDLARSRFYGIGMKLYGPYPVGRYDTLKRRDMSREEVADIFAYAVLIDRIERPYNESERHPVIVALERLWSALDAQAAAPEITSPGHPEAGDPPAQAPPLGLKNAPSLLDD